MNEAHLRICASPEWAAFVESELLPWVLAEQDLGDEVLEVGPGPGLTTDVLRRQVPRLTAVEIDERLAAAGFVHVTVEVEEDRFRFAATTPGAGG